MKSVKEAMKSSPAIVSMLIMVQIFATGMELLSREILVNGTFVFAFSAYRYVVAAFFIAPFALYFERNREKKFTLKVWFWIFINALAGMTIAQGLYYYGLRDTSATYSTNFLNLVLICTFAVSIICSEGDGKAKCVGAIMCVGGALVASLYKGHEFFIGHGHHDSHSSLLTQKTNMLRGTIFLVLSCFSYTAWFIVQVKLLKEFPYKYWGTMLACIMASVQSAVIGLCIDSSSASWKIHKNLQLVTIFYSGALATGVTLSLLSWAISVKGPTYPPMFNPLALIFVAISGTLILGESLKVGTLLGMVLTILGLYSFSWGKKKEAKSLAQSNVAASEVSIHMVAEPTVPQATAVAASRTSSPTNNVVLEVETTNKLSCH